MKLVLIVGLLFILLVLLLLFWMGHGPLKAGASLLKVEKRDLLVNKTPVDKIKIVSWNLAYAHGKGSDGEGYQRKKKQDYDQALKGISEVLKSINADIVFLQEIDFCAKRSYFEDQAKFLAESAGYAYIASAPSWILNYVPFPQFPLRNQFGRMNSGGAILSRFPIANHEVKLFSKPKSNPWWYNLFYLFRYAQKVSMKIAGKEYQLINVHLEAFDGPSREEQVTEIENWMKGRTISLMVGDFNSVESVHQKEEPIDHTLDLVRSKLNLKESIDLKDKKIKRFYTFPADTPDRRLDHLFFNETSFEIVHEEVIKAGELSDHLPVVFELKLK